jgi:hypothetical protein
MEVSQMDQTDARRPGDNNVVAEAIALVKKVDEMRSVAIAQLLAQRDQIEQDLKTLGYDRFKHGVNGANGTTPIVIDVPVKLSSAKGAKRFRSLTLAEVGKILLAENGSLHGKKIEELAKAGGFKGGAKNFQNYMPVAFKRDGGFVNIGGNTWKLKEDA